MGKRLVGGWVGEGKGGVSFSGGGWGGGEPGQSRWWPSQSWSSPFQSGIVLWKNDICLYSVLLLKGNVISLQARSDTWGCVEDMPAAAVLLSRCWSGRGWVLMDQLWTWWRAEAWLTRCELGEGVGCVCVCVGGGGGGGDSDWPVVKLVKRWGSDWPVVDLVKRGWFWLTSCELGKGVGFWLTSCELGEEGVVLTDQLWTWRRGGVGRGVEVQVVMSYGLCTAWRRPPALILTADGRLGAFEFQEACWKIIY